jgi:hypothetical protein
VYDFHYVSLAVESILEGKEMEQKVAIRWLPEPAEDTYQSAQTFLELMFRPKKARRWVKRLKKAGISQYAAKDILRASGTPMATIKAFDWKRQQEQIAHGDALSPILLIRQDDGGPLIIADGFHRMCALFATDQEVSVPCKIV